MSSIFAKVPTAAIFDKRVSDAELRALAAVASYANKSNFCFPGIGTIAKRRGLSRQAVQKQIRKVQHRGYLKVSRDYRPTGGCKANIYEIIFLLPQGTPKEAIGSSLEDSGYGPSQEGLDRGWEELCEIAAAATPEVAYPYFHDAASEVADHAAMRLHITDQI